MIWMNALVFLQIYPTINKTPGSDSEPVTPKYMGHHNRNFNHNPHYTPTNPGDPRRPLNEVTCFKVTKYCLNCSLNYNLCRLESFWYKSPSNGVNLWLL